MATPETTALATAENHAPVVNAPPVPVPIVPVAGMIGALQQYQKLQAGLDNAMPDQLMTIQGKPFRKKGYWRAVAQAFNLNVEPIKEEYVEHGDDWGYLVTYRATYYSQHHPDGIGRCGDGSCFASEKSRGRMAASHHNVRAHAHTRAFNRAVSNCVGFGEVSAEEISDEDRGRTAPLTKPSGRKSIINKAEAQHLKAIIEAVNIPPEIVKEHVGKAATELTPPECHDLIGWIVERECTRQERTDEELAAAMAKLGKKHPADLTLPEFGQLLDALRGE